MTLQEIKEGIGIKPYFSTENGVLYNADCLDVMAKMPDKCVDLVLTDPPYRNEEDNQPTMDMRKNGGMDSFGNKLTDKQFKEIERVSDKQIIWGFNNFDFLPGRSKTPHTKTIAAYDLVFTQVCNGGGRNS